MYAWAWVFITIAIITIVLFGVWYYSEYYGPEGGEFQRKQRRAIHPASTGNTTNSMPPPGRPYRANTGYNIPSDRAQPLEINVVGEQYYQYTSRS